MKHPPASIHKHAHAPPPNPTVYQPYQPQPNPYQPSPNTIYYPPTPIYMMQQQYPNSRPQSPVKKSEWWIALLLIIGCIAGAVVFIISKILLGAIVCGVVFVLTLGYILFRNSLLDNCFCVCCCDITPCVECCCGVYVKIGSVSW